MSAPTVSVVIPACHIPKIITSDIAHFHEQLSLNER